MQLIGRDSRLKDPLADEEGMTSVKYVGQERQAINDLEKRIVDIRSAIQRKNLETACTVGKTTMTVQDWLNFRREVADGRKRFLSTLNQGIKNIRVNVQQKGGKVVSAVAAQAVITSAENPPVEVLLNLDERELFAEQEGLEQTLGELDGKLSLLNATTVIEV